MTGFSDFTSPAMIRTLFSLSALLILITPAVYSETEEEDRIDVKFYGFVLVNTHFNDTELYPEDIPVTAIHGDRENFSITPRQSRVGVKLKGPKIENATVFGQIELDLWGLRGSDAPGGITQSAPRFRLALLGLKWKRTTLTVGQDWVRAFAPLNPTSLSHQAIPSLSGAGNLWNRLPQIRIDHRAKVTDTLYFQVSGAFLRPFGADADPTPVTQDEIYGGGEFAGMPFYQVRVALAGRLFQKNWAAGLAGHYGQEEYFVSNLKTSGVAMDFKVPIGQRVLVSGEAFDGENLKMLFANAYRFGNPEEDPGAVAQNTTGGWIQISYQPTSRVQFNTAYGMESLDQDRLAEGDIEQNSGFFANMIFSFHRSFKMAFEVLHLETKRAGEPDEDGNAFDLALQYLF